MAGPSWIVDGNRIATKIKSASVTYGSGEVKWKSNPTRSCPRCQHTIDNNDVAQAWPGLPRGVKFDPTDQEIIQHLYAKAGAADERPHPFINEFIPTVDEEDGICYTHPQNLPGVKQDGTASHFFHRAIKAYNTGTRKRRKIHGDDLGDVRWHKTGRTKPVILNGVQRGCKKIMVLYVSSAKGGKAEKTNWVMHQYHLGTEEDEKDGDFVISKVFCQQPQVKQSDKNEGSMLDVTEDVVLKADPLTPKSVTPEPPRSEGSMLDVTEDVGLKVDPVTPKSVTPEPPRSERQLDPRNESTHHCLNSVAEDNNVGSANEVRQPEVSKSCDEDSTSCENHTDQVVSHDDNQDGEDHKWWDSESQYLIDSQQLVEGLSLCDDLLQSQSPNRDGNTEHAAKKRYVLSEYAHLGPDDLKKDLEACQNLDLNPANLGLDAAKKRYVLSECRLGPDDLKNDLEESQNLDLDPANIILDTPPDIRLSQLEFGSQDSFQAWGVSKTID